MDWFRARDIGPLIGTMKDKFNEISRKEFESFFAGSMENASQRDMIKAKMHRVVNKQLHCVIKNIDLVAKEQGPAEAAKLADSIVRQTEEVLQGLNSSKRQ